MIDYISPQQFPIDINNNYSYNQILEEDETKKNLCIVNYNNSNNDYYTFCVQESEKDVAVFNIFQAFKYFWENESKNDLYFRLSDRLYELLDIEDLEEDDITPQYNSFEGFFHFLKDFEYINNIDFSITMTNDGEIAITSEPKETYFRVRFIDQINVVYYILNRNKNSEIFNRESIETMKEDLKKYYVL